MIKTVRVRYENGVLKPLEPVDLMEGEEALIIIIRREKKISEISREESIRESLSELAGILNPGYSVRGLAEELDRERKSGERRWRFLRH